MGVFRGGGLTNKAGEKSLLRTHSRGINMDYTFGWQAAMVYKRGMLKEKGGARGMENAFFDCAGGWHTGRAHHFGRRGTTLAKGKDP